MKLHIACLALACLTLAAVRPWLKVRSTTTGRSRAGRWLDHQLRLCSQRNLPAGEQPYCGWYLLLGMAGTWIHSEHGRGPIGQHRILFQQPARRNHPSYPIPTASPITAALRFVRSPGNFARPALNAGNYLPYPTNATTVNGDPVFWDSKTNRTKYTYTQHNLTSRREKTKRTPDWTWGLPRKRSW